MDRNQTRRGVVNLIQPSGRNSERRAAVGFVRYVDGIRLRVSEEILQPDSRRLSRSVGSTSAIVLPIHGDAF